MTSQLFEAVEAFDGLLSPQDIIDSLKQALNSSGVRYFCLNTFPGAEGSFAEQIIACEVPPEWLDLYLREDFATADPAIRHCRKVVMPFDYLDAPFDAEREPRAAEVVQRAREFGLDDGTLFPVSGPSGNLGDLWIAGKEQGFTPGDVPAIHLLGLYAFHKIQQLAQPCRSSRPTLSAREREVLTWVAAGKTAAEVGEVLNISQRTVEWHIQQAAQKLGAKNRMQAVVIAARDRLIQI